MTDKIPELTEEQLQQYLNTINKIRKSKKYKNFEKIREIEKNEYKASIAENRPIKFSKQHDRERKKLIKSIFADFEKFAKNIPGATKSRPQSKQNLFQKIFKRKNKDYYIPGHIEMAFWKELEQPGTFKEEYSMRTNNTTSSHSPISKEKIAEIRGTQKANHNEQTKTPNPYKNMSSEKFNFAIRAAYDNLACLQKNGWDSEKDKNLILADIQAVLSEAQKRYPDIPKIQTGEFFKDSSIANMESQLFPILKEASKTDPVAMQDVKNYTAWRNNENSNIGILTEEPFQNKARYCAGGKYECFRSPLKTANNIMTESDIAIEKAKTAKLTMR